MSSANGSTKVIVTALMANLGIALAKFVGAAVSSSTSLLAEAIHSLVDSTNQVLLLVGSKKSLKAPDESHPLGYGREAFFWSFLVAILLFSMGGMFAIYEGLHQLKEPKEMNSPWLGLSILGISLVLEAYSFWACYQEVRKQNTRGSLWTWFKETKNSELLVIFTEDAAALVGLVIATISLSLSWWTRNSHWDSWGSIAIGAVLVVVAVLLALEVKSFLIGESPSHELKDFVNTQVPQIFPGGQVLRLIAVQTGSQEVMLSFKLHPGPMINDLKMAIDKVNTLEKQIKSQFPSVRWQFVELDHED